MEGKLTLYFLMVSYLLTPNETDNIIDKADMDIIIYKLPVSQNVVVHAGALDKSPTLEASQQWLSTHRSMYERTETVYPTKRSKLLG